MTNGEKIKEIFPNIIKYGNILIDDTGALQKNILFDDTWWNAEYKEPTTQERQAESDKFDAAYQDGYNCGYAQARFDYEQGSTTKNVIRDNEVINELNRFKNELDSTTKNDLAVDCMKKSDAINIIQDMHGLARKDVISDAVNRIIELPPVTPQEPKTGHWINIDATHSKCDKCGAIFEIASSNGEINYCPNCGSRNEVKE